MPCARASRRRVECEAGPPHSPAHTNRSTCHPEAASDTEGRTDTGYVSPAEGGGGERLREEEARGGGKRIEEGGGRKKVEGVGVEMTL